MESSCAKNNLWTYRSVKKCMKTVSAHVRLGPPFTGEPVQRLLHGSVWIRDRILSTRGLAPWSHRQSYLLASSPRLSGTWGHCTIECVVRMRMIASVDGRFDFWRS